MTTDMKTEPNDLINAFEEVDSNGNHYYTHYGLTKREEFAKAAMQGILASTWGKKMTGESSATIMFTQVIPASVKAADLLIEELNKEQP